MAGSPKKRARRMAAEAAAQRGVVPAPLVATEAQSNTWNGRPTERREAPKARPFQREEVINGAGIAAAAERVSRPEEFEKLIGLSLAAAIEIMEEQLDSDHREFGRLLSLKASIATSVFGVTSRVAGDNLRKKADDKLGGLLKRLRDEPVDPVANAEAEQEDGGERDNENQESHDEPTCLDDML